MPIQEEESTDIFSEQEECGKEIQDDSTTSATDNVSTTITRINLIPPSTQREIFSHFQPQELSNLTIPARRRKRPQYVCKDINNTDNNESKEDFYSTKCSTNIVVDNVNTTNTSTALVHKPHSDLALTIDKVTTASRAGLDLAGLCTGLVFEAAKLSTRASLGIAKTVTGVMSDRLVQAMSQDGNSRYVF